MLDSFPRYLERAKALTNTTSDSNMARKIGVSRAFLCECRAGRKYLSEDRMLDLAKRADLDQDEALILLNMWKAHGEARDRYANMLKKFTGLATCIGLIFSPLASIDAKALNNIEKFDALHVKETVEYIRVLNIMR